MGEANLPGATTNPVSVGVSNDSGRASITRIVLDRAIGIKLEEAMRWWDPANVHGGFCDDVMLIKEDNVEVSGNGIDFFEDGVTVEVGSLHDGLVSSGPDGPASYGEKDGLGDATWGCKLLMGRSHASYPVQGAAVLEAKGDGAEKSSL